MPWEVTIRAPGKGPLGHRDSLVESISATVPAVDWIEEPPLLDRIKDMPDHPFHALIPTWPQEALESAARSKLYGYLDSGECSMQFYGFEREPIESIGVEVRGTGNPVPLLAAICIPNGWIATDDCTGQPIDLTADSAAGWEQFCEYRSRVIEDSE